MVVVELGLTITVQENMVVLEVAEVPVLVLVVKD
tara:strand:- start:486 stop:587 length:102 start_codon:yes stop_codon:yes gene_type:complete